MIPDFTVYFLKQLMYDEWADLINLTFFEVAI